MIPRYSIKEELDWGTGYPVYRALRDQDNLPVIIKTHLPGQPDSAIIQKFIREYEFIKDKDIDGILKVYELITNENQVALILEDSDGMPLHHWLDGKVVEIEAFLKIAILLSKALTALHQPDLIHGDIRPANILINFPAGQLKLTGIGLAIRHSEGENMPAAEDFSTQHLSYVSPEQTGRMNRSPDYRSDFYSLGVTFYEMLIGKLPFNSSDPLELLHCHIAIEPASPSEVNPAIPKTISAIILKLLAKAPEDRYQSGMGLTKDLQECLRQWQQTGKIEVFIPGKHDMTDRFEIPQKLYGREAEVAKLLSFFERVGKGAAEMMLVTGYSGIGKSALVNEVRKPIIQRRGYFINGKFDQLKSNLPYNAIIQAFKELIRQILTENEQRIIEWKEKLLRVLGANGQVIIAVIPEVEMIIGPQPPVAELPPVESQNRFNLVFQNFIEVFAREEHPLIIFLDDLQWADAATLRLLQTLVTDPNFHHLFFIGAYRDNEVETSHPLLQTLKKLRESGIELITITLGPLRLTELNKFISHILKCHPRRSKPLSELVLSKTGGNPFFVTQFMKSLYQENLLEFDHRRRQWKFKLERILRKDLTDNVVDFMAGKILRLSSRAQQVARLAACIGNRFELNILAIVIEKSTSETLIDLGEVLREGLIVPFSEPSWEQARSRLPHKDGSGIKDNDSGQPLQSASFRFLHDRVQQAAYALIPNKKKAATHLKVGRLIFKHIDETRREEYLFEIVNQLNTGAELTHHSQERENLGRLNLQAGRKAKSATAYQTALNYFRSGIVFLQNNCWISQYELAFELYREQAECEYLCGNFEEAGRVFDLLMEQAQTRLDKAKLYNLRILQYEYMSRYLEAIRTGQEALALFGYSFPDPPEEKQAAVEEKLSAIEALAGERGIESFISLPAMEDPEMCMVMQLLSNLHTPCFLAGDKPLTMLNTATMVHLSLLHGNTKESAYAYALHAAMTLAPLKQEYAAAYDFGILALKVNDRFYDPGIRARVLMTFAWAISIWRKPIQDSFSPTREAFRLGNETGFFVDAAYALFNESWFALLSGADLETFRNTYASNAKYIKRVEMHQFADAQQVILQWGFALEGRTEHPTSFSDANFDENVFCETYRDYPLFRMFYLVAKLVVLYTFDEYRAACEVADQAEEVIKDFPGTIWDELRVFYHALALAALYPSVSKKEQHEIKATLEVLNARLRRWAENAPYLYRLQHLIVSAEIARLHGQDSEAITLYESVIEAASESECPRESGLANEVYARFWLRRKQRKVAAVFMNEARSAYTRWNAKAKVEALERAYPELLSAQSFSGVSFQTKSLLTSSTAQIAPESKAAAFDLFTVLKAAQAISGEIVVEKLLKNLMRIAIENAGAQKGYLIIQRGTDLVIEMHGSVEKNEIKVEQTLPPESNQLLSSAIINYVKRTLENLVIAEAEFDTRFTHDEYIARNHPKSILCVPILNQGQLTGLLYLENNLMTAAFTPDRIEVMQILASQATISLENARLYEEMRKEITERKYAEEALQQAHEELDKRVKERTRELSRANTLLTQQIKERLETEKALRESENAYRDLYEEAPNVYVSTDTDGRIKRANQRAAEFFGLELEEIIGKPIFNLVADGSTGKERAQRLFQRFISGKETLGEEIQFRKADGSLVWGSVSVRLFMNQSGKILASRSIIVDIDERKNVELKLQEAKEAAEAANRAKSEFLANMSHELRTPLNSILGYAQVLKRDKNLNENQMKGLEIIEKSGEHLLTLINDILDLSKIETGKLEVHSREFSLPEFLKNIAEISRVGALQKGLEFNYRSVSPLPAVVLGDEKRLRQVLLNLLGNAVKFTDPATPATPYPKKGKLQGHSIKGSITFTVGYIEHFSPLHRGRGTFTAVSGDQKNRGNPRFCFQVEDTGSGIEAERLEEIFLPFHQIPHKHKPVEGTGLGLAISQKLVKLMGGELQMTSKPGKGSIFRVVLEMPAPFKERDTAVLMEKSKKSSGEINGYAGDPRKILIVDDKWENRSVVINLLSPLGFLLEEARNGKEAIKKALDFQPHLILMDLVMPEMDGFEAVRNIRKSAKLKDVVIIALSASVFEHNRRQSAKAGCDDFIPKPLSAELLLSKLQYYLNLEWIRLQERKEVSADIPPNRSRDPQIGPPSARAKGLYELAMMGDIHDLEREISLLEKENRELIPFVARIRELLMNYKMKQVREFVKQFME